MLVDVDDVLVFVFLLIGGWWMLVGISGVLAWERLDGAGVKLVWRRVFVGVGAVLAVLRGHVEAKEEVRA